MTGSSVGDCSRRTLLLGLGTAVVPGASFAAESPQAKGASSMEQWMDSWMAVAARDVSGTLYISRFKDPMYFLLKPISWKLAANSEARAAPVQVPIGFVTDFASIPRAFYSLLKPDGDYSYAAVMHDYLYWSQTTSKEEADTVFKLVMEEFAIDKITTATLYNAVKSFGRKAWDGNAKLKSQGEQRILAKFPEDPRLTWQEWKKNDVFAGS
jgi:Protein of unknown function (DUF1353)